MKKDKIKKEVNMLFLRRKTIKHYEEKIAQLREAKTVDELIKDRNELRENVI